MISLLKPLDISHGPHGLDCYEYLSKPSDISHGPYGLDCYDFLIKTFRYKPRASEATWLILAQNIDLPSKTIHPETKHYIF